MLTQERRKKLQTTFKKIDICVEAFQRATSLLKTIRKASIKYETHARAINATKAIDGLECLLKELTTAQEHCLKLLGAKEIPIDNLDKKVHLKLVVDNTKGGKV